MKLNEGLDKGDLEGMVEPTITIDDFESKVDAEQLIVVTFYVDEEWPAKDLKRFIEKTPVEIIDVDRSPSPDINGKFLVFVELERNDQFPERLIDIVGSLNNLTNIDNFKFKAYKHKGEFDLNENNIKNKVRLTPETEITESAIYEFMKESNLNNVNKRKDVVTFTRRGVDYRFKLVDFDHITNLYTKHSLHESAQNLLMNSMGLESVLGNNWDVSHIDDMIMLTKMGSDDALLLKKV